MCLHAFEGVCSDHDVWLNVVNFAVAHVRLWKMEDVTSMLVHRCQRKLLTL